jgi:beta-1,4-mannosyltransferase
MRDLRKRSFRILANPAWKNRNENPYNALLYDAVIDISPSSLVVEYSPTTSLRNFDVIHWHWPEGTWNSASWLRSFFRASLLYAEIDLARVRGGCFVWTFHNLIPHDAKHPRLAAWCAQRLVRRADGAVFLTEASRKRAYERFARLRNTPSAVIPHGDYKQVLTQPLGKTRARKQLGIPEEAKVIGFIGKIRPYKELETLVAAFASTHDPCLRLLIAGEPDGSSQVVKCLKKAQSDKRSILLLSLLDDRSLQTAVEACDLLVFPNRKVVNSGSTIYALSNNRPVLVPQCEPMIELVNQAGANFVRLFAGELSMSDLMAALEYVSTCPGGSLSGLPSWHWIAKEHLELYSSTCQRLVRS